jgi:hypothetical protein
MFGVRLLLPSYFDDFASRLNHRFPSGFAVYPRDSQSRVFYFLLPYLPLEVVTDGSAACKALAASVRVVLPRSF